MTFNTIIDFFKFFFFSLGKNNTNTLITVAAGFFGVLAGSVISRKSSKEAIKAFHKNAIDLLQRQQFNKVATEFRNAFYPELIFLKHNAIIDECGSSDSLEGFLRFGYLHRHLKALETFKTYLTPEERIATKKKWEEYCNFTQYSDKTNEAELKKLALERIEKILKFAKHK